MEQKQHSSPFPTSNHRTHGEMERMERELKDRIKSDFGVHVSNLCSVWVHFEDIPYGVWASVVVCVDCERVRGRM